MGVRLLPLVRQEQLLHGQGGDRERKGLRAAGKITQKRMLYSPAQQLEAAVAAN